MQGRQRVRVNSILSGWRTVTCGVSQGTKLGPVIFLAMVDYIATDHPDRWKIVDDITLAVTSDGKGSVDPGKTQMAMDGVSALAKRGHMMVNRRKCSTALVTASRSPGAAEVTIINNTIIPQVETLKLLGVTIQSDLK